MTDKLPKVGETYYERKRAHGPRMVIVDKIEEGQVIYSSWGFKEKISIKKFFDNFEKIPETKEEPKLQEREEVQLSEEVREMANKLRVCLFSFGERVLKEKYDEEDWILDNKDFRFLGHNAKNLLDALDKQFSQKQEETKKKIEEDCPAGCANQEKQEESIWKPISELPERGQFLLFQKNKNNYSLAYSEGKNIYEEHLIYDCGDGERYNMMQGDSFANLTDFINEHEQLKADVVAIKKQLEDMKKQTEKDGNKYYLFALWKVLPNSDFKIDGSIREENTKKLFYITNPIITKDFLANNFDNFILPDPTKCYAQSCFNKRDIQDFSEIEISREIFEKMLILNNHIENQETT